MNFARMRFVLALGLFAVWLGWLLYMAVSTSKPIVLSEPQFLVSSLDVVAEVPAISKGGADVVVQEVSWPTDEGAKLKGQKLHVTNLDQCREDWKGPGPYILALAPDGKEAYRVAPLPRSPGFGGPTTTPGRPRIYPVTASTQAQLKAMRKPEAVIQ
jgi:hypothetical protein